MPKQEGTHDSAVGAVVNPPDQLTELFHADGRTVFARPDEAGNFATEGFLPYPADPRVLLGDLNQWCDALKGAAENHVTSAEATGEIDPASDTELHVLLIARNKAIEAAERVIEASYRKWPLKQGTDMESESITDNDVGDASEIIGGQE